MTVTGLVIVLLSVPVVQSQEDWGVTYSQTEVCALEGSTVELSCTYTYPYSYRVTKSFWFTNEQNEPVDLRTDSQYTGRVTYRCERKRCTLRITHVKKRDSATYKFRFITNKNGGRFIGHPGVVLSVTDPDLQVQRIHSWSAQLELKCHSRCVLPQHVSYHWYKNGQEVYREYKSTYEVRYDLEDEISCALQRHVAFPSPSVYAPKVPSVVLNSTGEIVESSSVTLTCSSDANPAASFTWFKRNERQDFEPFSSEQRLIFSSIQSSDAGEYRCTAENSLGQRTSAHIIDVKYAPRPPTVSLSPSGKIMEGISVNLTCSSDANPAANYTWNKENQTTPQGLRGLYRFTTVSPEDRGTYFCKSENQYGRINSSPVFIDVQYCPRLPSVSVSPVDDIMEGISVNLTCSSDANPAANYTWYKENQTLPQGHKGTYSFPTIWSKDSGMYSCKSENKYGHKTSKGFYIDVQYAPRLPSVSLSSSAAIVEGTSLNLTCSSDANPAANYTWYKEDEDSPVASGQIFIITDIRFEHGGNYYCEAHNTRGRHNSTLHLVVVSGSMKSVTAGLVTVLFLVVILLSVFLFVRKKRSLGETSRPGGRLDNKGQLNMASANDDPSASARRQPAEEQEEVCYATVSFSKNDDDPLYSNVLQTELDRPKTKNEEEEDDVEYSVVKIKSDHSLSQTRCQQVEEDPSELYSTVNKKPRA